MLRLQFNYSSYVIFIIIATTFNETFQLMNKEIKKQLGRLDKDLVQLFEDLQHYSDKTLNLSPSDTAWSVMEIMQHLYLAEKNSLDAVQGELEKETVFASAGFVEKVRSFALKTALSSPFKFKAPYTLNRDAFISNPTFWEVAKSWKNERIRLKQFFNEIPEDLLTKSAYKHPVGGLLTLHGMLAFYEGHFKRHHKQIKRTLDTIDAVKQI